MSDLDEPDQPRPLFEVICSILGERHARELVQELWGLGLTVASRPNRRDPFEIDPKTWPPGMAYQWVPEADLAKFPDWQQVPLVRYDGIYGPIGSQGPIIYAGMALVERDDEAVQAAHQARTARAEKNLADWQAKWGAVFAGHVKVGTSEETAKTDRIGEPALGAMVSAAVKIPPDLWEHADKIFAERDQLRRVLAGSTPEVNEQQLTEMAIVHVSEALKKERAA